MFYFVKLLNKSMIRSIFFWMVQGKYLPMKMLYANIWHF